MSLKYLVAIVLLFCLCWNVVVAVDKPARKFGPEWKLDKDGGHYTRKVEIEQSHSVGGNVGGFTIPLENDSVNVIEVDNAAGFDLNCKYGQLSVSKNKKGEVTELSAEFRRNIYYDIDADGMIDYMVDWRSGSAIPMILLDGKFVVVADSKNPFGKGIEKYPQELSRDRKTHYEFVKGAWKEKPVK